ncbi:LAFA_0E19394g1_1 [Lachancea sp. 'fantastica']|nr:LAFA_0E19394g1_1 [Lachancea sp. 'fantastica']
MSFAVGATGPSSSFQFFGNGKSNGEKGFSRSSRTKRRDKSQQRPPQVGKRTFHEGNTIKLEQTRSDGPLHRPWLSVSQQQQQQQQQSALFKRDSIQNTSKAFMLPAPEELGFKRVLHKPRETPKYLIEQKASLKPRPFVQDPWDYENQQKMLAIEKRVSDTTELWETFKKMRETERRVMEDKKLVDRADSAKDLNDAIIFQGTCQDMCPIFERARRSVENNVVRYEREDENSKAISRLKALKVFARPAAAAAPPLPSDVRPPKVLITTLDYIVDNIVGKLPDCEGFLWDRMRSIRQDFTYQNYSGPEAVDCNERIVRIHLLILHVMATSEVEYSRQQELEQLHKALITLSEIYDEVRASDGQCPNEAEFRAYSLLSRIRDPEYDKMAQSLPQSVFDDRLVQIALCFRRILSNSTFSERGHVKTENGLNLYKRFFELIKSDHVPFLMASFLEVHLNEIRFYAVKSLSHSINKKHKPFPLEFLESELMFNNIDELLKFCDHYSIEVDAEGVKLTSLSHHSHVISEATPLKQSYLKVVDEKLARSNAKDLINCGTRNLDTIPLHSTHVSNDNQTPDNQFPEATFTRSEDPLKSKVEWPAAVKTAQFAFQAEPKNDRTDISTGPNKTSTNPFTLAHNVEAPKEKLQSSKSSEVNDNQKVLFGIDNNQINNENTPRQSGNMQLVEGAREVTTFPQLKPQQNNVGLTNGERRRNENRVGSQLEASRLVAESLIQNVVRDEVSAIVNKSLASSSKKKRIIRVLAEDLFHAFLHEKIYLTTLEARAEQFHSRTSLKQAMKIWEGIRNKRCEQRKLERKRREELLQVSRCLGVPLSKRHRVDATPTSTLSFSPSLSIHNQVIHTPVANQVSQFKTPVHENNAIWKPIDFKSLYLSVIEGNLKEMCTEHESILRKPILVEVSIFARNWDSISSRWLLAKFGLEKRRKTMLRSNNSIVDLTVSALSADASSREFENLQLLVFNSGVTENDIFDLEVKLKQDGEKLIELTHAAALHTNYTLSIEILYWESTENPLSDKQIAKLLKIDKISETFAAALKDVQIVKLAGDSPHQILEDSLAKIAGSSCLELTERGRYNLLLRSRSLQASSSTPGNYRTAREIDSKLSKALEKEIHRYQQERDRNNTYAHLQSHVAASPRSRHRKLAVLLSDRHRNRFKTPLAVRPFFKRTSSTSSTSSVLSSEPSHLAAKIRAERPRHENTTSNFASPVPSRTQPEGATAVTPSISMPIANTSGISNVTFDSPFATPTLKMAPPSSTDLQDTNTSVLELRDLVASVKKSLNRQ